MRTGESSIIDTLKAAWLLLDGAPRDPAVEHRLRELIEDAIHQTEAAAAIAETPEGEPGAGMSEHGFHGSGVTCPACEAEEHEQVLDRILSAQNAPEWPREPLPLRLAHCLAMLSIHGCLTDTERTKARKRITKLAEQAAETPDPETAR